MPGFVIHIAIAEQYYQQHKLEIKKKEELIRGVIAPDLNKDMTEIAENKSETHYEKWGNNETKINIHRFLKDPQVNLQQDYWKGYLIHLLTDDYFYYEYFEKETKEIQENKDNFYYDYDCLNEFLIKKYDIELKENIQKYVKYVKGNPKYLKSNKVINFIETIGEINLKTEIDRIIKKNGGNK